MPFSVLLAYAKKLTLEIEPLNDGGDVTTCLLPSREYAYTQQEQE